jgi:hypothetical protein
VNDGLDRQAIAEQVAAAKVAMKEKRVGVNGQDEENEEDGEADPLTISE